MERELLYQRIYSDLLQGIRDKTYPPGSRLPSEKELAERYGVSRITSKKALEMLADQKRISRMPGKGSFVLDDTDVEIDMEERSTSGVNALTGKRMIGVVFDDFSSTFGSDILHGIEYECRKRDYYMLLKCTYGSVAEETKAIDDLIALGVDGIILMCVQGETYNANILKLVLEKFPIVLVDRELTGLPIPCVNSDNYSAAKDLMHLLFDNGHTDICFLSHPFVQTSTVAARFSGYLDSMLERGLSTNENMWIRNLGTVLPGMDEQETEEDMDLERIRTFIKENPQVTGFFAVDQPIGGMVYRVLKEMGLEKKKEVAFFDGIVENYGMSEGFSCVIQGQYMMGVRAVKLLHRSFRGEAVPQKYCVPYTLVKGEYFPEKK